MPYLRKWIKFDWISNGNQLYKLIKFNSILLFLFQILKYVEVIRTFTNIWWHLNYKPLIKFSPGPSQVEFGEKQEFDTDFHECSFI